MSRMSGAHLRGFALGPTHQGRSDDESLATCERFDRLWYWFEVLLQKSLKAKAAGPKTYAYYVN